MSFVCLSVCLSVRDVAGLAAHRLEILETNCLHLLPREHGEILGRLEVGWEKVACWSTKAAISLKRVKIEEKLLWRVYRNLPTLCRMDPSPTPYTASSSPRLGICSPTQNSSRYYGDLRITRNFKFGQNNNRVNPNKSPLKFWRKTWVYPGTVKIFGYPLTNG